MVIDLDTIVLDAGEHVAGSGAGCLLEWASALAGEPWSDHPACVSPVLASYGRAINDRMPDAERQTLLPYLPRLIGTAGDPARDRRRAYLVADRAVRDLAPRALEAAGLPKRAATLRALATVTDRTAAAADAARAYAAYAADAARAYADAADAAADVGADVGAWQPALDLFDALINCA